MVVPEPTPAPTSEPTPPPSPAPTPEPTPAPTPAPTPTPAATFTFSALGAIDVYFTFNWLEALDSFKYNHAAGLANATQCRGGQKIWFGMIRFWNTNKDGLSGDSPGRRDSRQGQWQPGDIITNATSCPPVAENTSAPETSTGATTTATTTTTTTKGPYCNMCRPLAGKQIYHYDGQNHACSDWIDQCAKNCTGLCSSADFFSGAWVAVCLAPYGNSV